MNGLLINFVLAIFWAALTGDFSLVNLCMGFGFGFLMLVLTRRIVGSPDYVIKVWRVFGLLVFLLWELIKANVRVAYDVFTPGYHTRPGVIAVPLEAQTDLEITMLVVFINLTPGSVVIDVSRDRSLLFIHEMYVDDVELVRRQIKDGFERRVLEVLR